MVCMKNCVDQIQLLFLSTGSTISRSEYENMKLPPSQEEVRNFEQPALLLFGSQAGLCTPECILDCGAKLPTISHPCQTSLAAYIF